MAQPPDRVRHAPADALPVDSRSEHSRLLIRVSMGSGVGPTRLAAFDTALSDAGAAGYNIIRLSSVIPAHAEVRQVARADQMAGVPGDVAYCVYAAAYATTPGEQAWAGIAWAVPMNGLGVGLFVEHTASSESMVRHDLRLTIEAMSKTRGNQHRLAGQTVSSAVCIDHPVCAVVIAVYGTAGWNDLLNSEG